jgi:hypothetical protein
MLAYPEPRGHVMRPAVHTKPDGRRPLRGLLPVTLCLFACVAGEAPAQNATPAQEVRRVASCDARGMRKKNLYGMRFDVPKGMASKKVTDVDYVLIYVFPKGNEKEHLDLWHGSNVGGGAARQELLDASAEVRRGEWKCEENGGRDISGRTRDGKRWRHTTMFMGLAAYENVSEETARRFDEIIDGMCCDAEFFKKLTGRQ